MSPFQSIAARLLFAADASRAMIHLYNREERLGIVAEAVRQRLEQIRNTAPDSEMFGPTALQSLARGEIVAEEARAQLLAPLLIDKRLAGIISLHDAQGSGSWSPQAHAALDAAQDQATAALEAQVNRALGTTSDDLKAAAVQAVLDRLRLALQVQRCTYRQPVLDDYAFPVTFESRGDGVRALLGDFTIVQTGQPVINKLLQGRAQVVQPDCRAASDEPLFHAMLEHYGNMRAQIVTPYIRDDQLEGVLSVHELRGTRNWTVDEQKLAEEATQLIGQMVKR
jgi:GAF domain-containing protein